MAAANFDIRETVGKNRQQTTRKCEITKTIDFSKQAVAAGQSAAFLTTPPGFVFERCDGVLKKAEGEAATLDIGTEADADGMLDGGNVNGTVGASIARAGNETIAAGTLLSNTEVRVTCPAAAATLNVAIAKVTLVGYVTDV